MTLADERRAIRSGISAARQSQQLVDDLRSLESQRREKGALNVLERRGVLPAKPGRSTYTAPASGGGGIASPLKEVANTATYWPQGFLSSDGLFVLPAARKRQFTDANGDTVVIEFVDPEGTA